MTGPHVTALSRRKAWTSLIFSCRKRGSTDFRKSSKVMFLIWQVGGLLSACNFGADTPPEQIFVHRRISPKAVFTGPVKHLYWSAKILPVSHTFIGLQALWIGGKDYHFTDDVTWPHAKKSVSAELWRYSNGPEHHKGDCVYLDVSKYKLDVYNCNQYLHYVCEIQYALE